MASQISPLKPTSRTSLSGVPDDGWKYKWESQPGDKYYRARPLPDTLVLELHAFLYWICHDTKAMFLPSHLQGESVRLNGIGLKLLGCIWQAKKNTRKSPQYTFQMFDLLLHL